MNKIVSFKKEINFESIFQINSISLEHNLSVKEENIVKGNFIISGSYKKTEGSINIDDFSFELPFEINIDKKYKTDNITVDINDFYYEIIDNEALSINIEVIIDNLEEKEYLMEDRESIEKIIDIDENTKEEPENKEDKIQSIFEGLDYNEKYVTYKVHVMNDNDTIESITKEYKIKKSILEEYNNLMDLKVGDKIIIPAND
ncbi:MAG: LysM peptidoglycan-binding domain-containing protein [Bacilli bacterium]|nr:LysM peptidoglycan-binding domain-containing protein [Bacilli bacterium]